MLGRLGTARAAVALALLFGFGCQGADGSRGAERRAPAVFEGPRPAASESARTATWPFVLVARDGERIDLLGYGVGRGGYAVREVPDNGFAREFNVVTPTWTGEGAWLAFEYVPADGDADTTWRIALAEGRGDGFHVVAVSEHRAAAWADWAVATPDGARIAAWVLEDEYALHLMERIGDRLVVTERRHPEAVKAFPSFGPNGRLAVRLPLKGSPLRYANAIDGVLGEPLHAVDEVRFDARGERWAYSGRRADGWYVFAGTESSPTAEAGPFDEIGPFEFVGVELVRARVRDASGWRWVELVPR
ncbi:hypothetical protein Pla163_00730 [Planctomycetes bacterium Pla163]|uniref:WD40-like Beta Propeller Repeat protein n=1 Tax=Rohdeia mirabilis TaxID=2528008 RepID=A0A518CUT8_9BACT|nr:hypothetical protein Pla163_00730 [Planctomycetes bacterium Pla163]